MKKSLFLPALLFLVLAACAPANPTTTKTPVPIVIPPTLTANNPVIVTTSPMPPTQPIIPAITPNAIQVERWKEYQTAIATKLFPPAYYPQSPIEFLCEWEIIGQSSQEVYVWSVCMSIFAIESIGFPYHVEMPAVIHINADGVVQSVEIPGIDYDADIVRMFPPDAQEKYFGRLIHFQELTDHLKWRRGHPEEPPLIILSVMPTQ